MTTTTPTTLAEAVSAVQTADSNLGASVAALTTAVQNDAGTAAAAAAVAALATVQSDLEGYQSQVDAATTSLGGTPPTSDATTG